MKVTVIARDSFAHGSRQYVAGDPVEVSKGEADELLKAGLVADGSGAGGEKMEGQARNKMEAAPENKADQIVAQTLAEQSGAQNEDPLPSEEDADDESKQAAGKAARKSTAKK